MTIVVAYKWAANPQEAEVGADGTVDWSRAKASFGEYDAVAVELARQFADRTGNEVVGVSVGGAALETGLARKGALARGLDRLVLVSDESLDGAGSAETAAVLAAVVRALPDVQLVLAGDSSVDSAAGMVPALLAAQLGWPALGNVMELAQDGASLTVGCSVRGGTRTLRVEGPVVLSAAPDAAVPRVPGMKDILAAAKKPVETLDLAGLDRPGVAAPVEVQRYRPDRPARARHRIDATDPAEAARVLVAALRSDGVL